MQITIEHNGRTFRCDTQQARSLAITLDFDGPQPNHFGTDKATREVLKLNGFTGSTEAGGSCNVDTLAMIPHCNGTHTETVSHIVDEDIWVGHAGMDVVGLAVLMSVPIASAADIIAEGSESYRPPLDKEDGLITAANLQHVWARLIGRQQLRPQALIIRTLPNDANKRSRAYVEGQQPAFLTVEAMQWVLDHDIQHLLVDVPSVDRMYDDGLLTNHHLFWRVPEGTHSVTEQTRQDRTITEMVFADDDLVDGIYLLNLQVPAFASDAAPSRPILMPLTAGG